jgi:hypothetical protein
MRRSTLVFGLFLLLIAGIVGYNAFLRNQPPLQFTVAVDPSARQWGAALVEAFNARGVQVGPNAVRLVATLDATRSDVAVWQGRVTWTGDNHPLAWIPTAAWIEQLAPNNLTFDVVEPSLAVSPLVWGGFASRVDVMTQAGAQPFDWGAAQALAAQERWEAAGGQANWGFVNLAINWPPSSAAGVLALDSMMSAFQQSAPVRSSTFSDAAFRAWFAPLRAALQVSRSIGESPASVMSSRGAVAAAAALLPEAEWLRNLEALNRQETMRFAYPSFPVVLDFPLAMWVDDKTTEEERLAVRAFGDFVLSAEGQQITLNAGLRPLGVAVPPQSALFAAGAAYGILPDQTFSPGTTLERSTAEQLVRLLD